LLQGNDDDHSQLEFILSKSNISIEDPIFLEIRDHIASKNIYTKMRMSNLLSGGDPVLMKLENRILNKYEKEILGFDDWFRENLYKAYGDIGDHN
jgi:hypothetical protein